MARWTASAASATLRIASAKTMVLPSFLEGRFGPRNIHCQLAYSAEFQLPLPVIDGLRRMPKAVCLHASLARIAWWHGDVEVQHKERRKPIFQLEPKLRALMEVLCDAGQLEAATFEALARKCDIRASTLKDSNTAGGLSPQNEAKLANACGFVRTDSSWNDSNHPYTGLSLRNVSQRTDTEAAFRGMLQERWLGSARYRARQLRLHVQNRDAGHHEISDSSQGASLDTEMPLFLEASFGPFTHHGIKYGFSQAKLQIDIVCEFGATTHARFAHAQPVELQSAIIEGIGTPRLPTWNITALADRSILEGAVITSSRELLSLVGFRDGTIVKSTLSVDKYDAVLKSTNQDTEPLAGNKAAIIEMLCAMGLKEQVLTNGRIELSEHELRVEKQDKDGVQ